jgi:SNF2 family DNA or RNA helicase
MGLGKTLCVIAAVERLIDEGKAGGGLLIVPSSLKYQWARQIEKFTGGTAVVQVVDGDKKQRIQQYMRIRAGEVEYAVLNYEQVVNDWEMVRYLPRDFIALDEATAIKSFGAQRTRRVKNLGSEYRWALTGQPVENRAEEVFSIMEWVDPDVLGDFRVFDAAFIVRDGWGSVRRYKNLPLLFKTLSGAMVRATWADADVVDEMPKITEESLLVPFDPESARLYRSVTSDLLGELGKVKGGGFDLAAHYEGRQSVEGEVVGAVMSRQLSLRMLCDHPDLIRHSAWKYRTGKDMGSEYAAELVETKQIQPIRKEPKLDAAVKLVSEILAEDPKNKIVLFSYFKYMLDLLGDATEHLTPHVKFTGDMSAKEKDTAKQMFSTDPSVRLFLSSDAGGYGVDLPMANYLVSYDLPWSAGAWNQRNARIVRLSSEFEHVTVISLLMAGSVEERQYEALAQKQSVSDAIVDGIGHDTKGVLDLTLDSLTDFLSASEV